ncbi:hypothetical protein O181_026272 [Austropuccinia psidii MF-1]|uniref:Uncharacterized protein n=1 Tax=Austropuccinia psidii MF-1 TaxID=1389203 RepID=A0A9Q3CQ86_9BASI|nr:hypothetical protein [Austropuccinia psidii MF-1]
MARGVPLHDAVMRTPLCLTIMKAFLRENGCLDPKQADRNVSRQLAWFPQVKICPPSDGHFTPQQEQNDYLANEGWQW